jgi:hypothetical protein
MKSSWPIVIGFCAVALAAVWYDARNAALTAGRSAPTHAGSALVGSR